MARAVRLSGCVACAKSGGRHLGARGRAPFFRHPGASSTGCSSFASLTTPVAIRGVTRRHAKARDIEPTRNTDRVASTAVSMPSTTGVLCLSAECRRRRLLGSRRRARRCGDHTLWILKIRPGAQPRAPRHLRCCYPARLCCCYPWPFLLAEQGGHTSRGPTHATYVRGYAQDRQSRASDTTRPHSPHAKAGARTPQCQPSPTSDDARAAAACRRPSTGASPLVGGRPCNATARRATTRMDSAALLVRVRVRVRFRIRVRVRVGVGVSFRVRAGDRIRGGVTYAEAGERA